MPVGEPTERLRFVLTLRKPLWRSTMERFDPRKLGSRRRPSVFDRASTADAVDGMRRVADAADRELG
jgi:hypothetical protein